MNIANIIAVVYNESTSVQQKVPVSQKSSYEIFRITKQIKESSDDDDEYNGNHNLSKKPSIIKNKARKSSLNVLNSEKPKNYKLLGKTSTGSSLSEPMIPVSPYHSTNELSQSTIDNETAVQLLNRNKQRIGQENTVDMQPNSETYGLLGQTNSVIQVDNCSTERKKQVFINIPSDTHQKFLRREKCSLITSGLALLILTIIVIISVYLIIMILKQTKKVNQLSVSRNLDS